MFLQSETDLTMTLGIAAAVGILAALFFLFLLVRTGAALARARSALSTTSTGADRTEQRMFTILQAIPVALVETDTSGKFTFANRAAHQLLGRKDAELLGLRFHSATWGITYPDGRLIPPDLLPAARALRGQTVKGFQHMMVNPTTRRKMLVSVTAMPILNDVGEVVGSSSAIVETEGLSTFQPDPEEQLRSRYFDVAGVMLLALNRDASVRDINACGAEILGARREEIIGRDWIKDFLPVEDQQAARAFFEDVIEAKRDMPEQGEGWIVRADGTRRLLSWRGSIVRDERDRIAGTLSSGLDLTEARAAQEALRAKESEALVAQAAAAEHEGKLDEVRSALQARLYASEQALADARAALEQHQAERASAQAATDETHAALAKRAEDSEAALAEARAALEQHQAERTSAQAATDEAHAAIAKRAEDSEAALAEARAALEQHVLERDRAQAASSETQDALQRRAEAAETARADLEHQVAESKLALEAMRLRLETAEDALARAQRYETVGRLTGGVAHDFDSLLTVVIGALDTMLRQADQADRVRRLGAAALAATKRGERLTRQLMSFSQGEAFKLETLELEPILRGFEPMLRRAVDESRPLEMDIAHDLGSAVFDAAQLEAALVNLAANAKEAVRQGGTVAVRAERVRLADGQIADTPAGDYARLSVVDTGAGMSADVAARAFEPFFTTKAGDEATGLGLAQVYGFARQAGGGVGIDSAPGAGSTVSIYLPIVETPAASNAAEPAVTAGASA
jgi:PAS domain S-box-containing protein